MLFSTGHRQQQPVHIRRQQLSRHAGESILLMSNGFDTHLMCFSHNRPADIAAGSHHDIRLKIADDLCGARAASGQQIKRFHVAPDILAGNLALNTGNFNRRKGIARLGDELGLHSARVTGKEHLGAGVATA
ncbi:hypothetical protein SDC9_175376 [bioreactor metagenome]|uniref:Uncharacterized protein n=1 Tax=bioreactor metagenome TaxID=1076179 RepID=A0A645GPT5_9ZZZZ